MRHRRIECKEKIVMTACVIIKCNLGDLWVERYKSEISRLLPCQIVNTAIRTLTIYGYH